MSDIDLSDILVEFKEKARRENQDILILALAELSRVRRENEKLGNALMLIVDIGFDYDGFEKPESLKGLIDELVGIARKALSSDGKTARSEQRDEGKGAA